MRYNSLNASLKRKFGQKLYRLALEGGKTCPNRDGTIDTRGCSFCSGGSGGFAEGGGSVYDQIERAKARVAAKGAKKYIAYFQSYTATYLDTQTLSQKLLQACAHPDIAAIAVATRPDCLEPEKVELLRKINAVKPTWVELGLQTVHDSTARLIRRGYETRVYDDACARLRAAGLETVAHVILFLPGETEQMMLQTVRHAGKFSDGIKLQLLHVLKNTDMAEDYASGLFSLPDMDGYIRVLEKCIQALPPQVVIHRLTGDGDKRELTAPLWSADKKRVLNAINAAFERDNIVQGQCADRE